mgnify:CR=1 FL=1
MATATIKYLGNLRCELTHTASSNHFITDAPTDNHGKGEAFSPTDTMATSLAACMLTVMGIKANSLGFDLEGATAKVTKIMAAAPRRVSAIEVELNLQNKLDIKVMKVLEEIGRNCPVAKSLHPDLVQNIRFNWR